jgi:hypothetical protein
METTVHLEGKKLPPSCRSQRGLDWFSFFLADMQTGWGPFVAAYLTSKNWTQLDIGLMLTVGTLASMVLQIPIGALVDYVPAKRLLAAVAVAAISGSALLLALWPVFSVVLGAKILHAIASSLAGPVLAAISLGLVDYALLAVRPFRRHFLRQQWLDRRAVNHGAVCVEQRSVTRAVPGALGVVKHTDGDPVVALIIVEPDNAVGVDGVESSILQPIGSNLVRQAEAAAFLLEVKHDAAAVLRQLHERQAELIPTVTAA